MTQWEYMVENWTLSINSTNREELEVELNEYGKNGWELVSIIPGTDLNDPFSVGINSFLSGK